MLEAKQLDSGILAGIGTIVALLLVICFLYLLFRLHKETNSLRVDTMRIAKE